MQANNPMQATCGAKTRAGHPCKNFAMPNGRCRMHGGKSLKGIASPNQKANLKYSKYLPGRLLERYQETLSDPSILELNHEISLIDSRLTDLLTRVDSGESGALWAHLRKMWREFQTALPTEKAGYETIVGDLIEQGFQDYANWREIQDTVDQRRKLVESERKRLVETQQFITAEQAMILVTVMLGIIKEHVTDRDKLRAISDGFAKITIQ